MSWFSEFSEKAENILNTIDKNAALAFNKQSKQNKPIQTFTDSPDSPIKNIENESSACNSLSSSEKLKLNLYSSFTDSTSSSSHEIITEYRPNISAITKDKNSEYLQNEMLQNEIHSLSNEISLLLNRVKIAEQKSVDLFDKLSEEENKNTLLEKQISELILEKYTIDELATIYKKYSKSENILSKTENETENDSNLHEHYNTQIQELLQDKSNLEETLRKKEDEILLLKSRLSQKTYCFSADELQSRLRALTITLVQKQSSLDSLMAEKTALVLKLNQLQKRYDEVVGCMHQKRINMNDTDDVKAQIPSYKYEKGFYLNKIYSFVNSIVINGEIFFKKRSLIKIVFIFYIILMHFLIFLLMYLHMPVSTDV